jgi:hypothetical protein
MSSDAPADASALARLAHWLCRHVFLDLLSEADPFALVLRKIVASSGLIYLTVPMAFLVFGAYLAAAEGLLVGHTVFLAACLSFIPTFVVPWAYAKRTGRIPDAMMDMWLFGTWFGMTLVTLTSQYPSGIPFVAIAFNATLNRTPRMPLFLALVSVSFMLQAWNVAAFKTDPALAVLVPGWRPESFLHQFLNNVSTYVVAAVPIGACLLQSRQNDAMLNAARAALDLSKKVAGHLQNYDTDAVDEELAAYRAAVALPDPQLIQNYEAIVSNLNKYRPHLPNWMVNQSESSKHDASRSATGSHRSTRSTRSTALSSHSRTSQSEHSLLGAPLAHHGGGAHGGLLHGGGHHRPQSVTLALLEFSLPAATPTAAAFKDRATTAFVDRVHEWAAATSGSLHSFVGDVLQVSWNATHSVAQPEAKAARFLAKVAAANRDALHDGVVAVGAAHSGKAACSFSGTGRVQALTVSMKWREAHRALLAFGVRHGAVVVDAATAHAAAYTVNFRGVDVLAASAAGDAAPVEVHEVAGERVTADDDEWMYVLDKASGSANEKVTEALRMAVAGRPADAIALLDAMGGGGGDDDVAAAPLVQRLRRRSDVQLLNPGVAYHNLPAN